MGVRVREKEKGSGEWWVFINYNARRKAKKIGDKKTAMEVARKIEAKLVLGEFHLEEEEKEEIFSNYAQHWLDTYASTMLKHTTYQGYEAVLRNHLLTVFGDKPLADISREQVKELAYEKLKTGLSTRRVEIIIKTLGVIFNHALEDGLVNINPAARPGRFLKTKKDRKKEVNPFTREEVALMLDTAREYFPRYFPLLLCAARSGLRLGEILALQWGDLDFDSRFIEVKRNYTHGKVVTPKSDEMGRVDMSQQLAQTLLLLKVERKKETLVKGWKEMPPWVFVNEEGGLIDPWNLRKRVFYRCLEKAGLRRIRFHDLRHTFASLLIQQGESLAYVQQQLRHHSIKLTVDTYGHLIPGANKQAVARLDDENATYAQPRRRKRKGNFR